MKISKLMQIQKIFFPPYQINERLKNTPDAARIYSETCALLTAV